MSIEINTAQTEIDWFALDMDAFAKAYNDCKTALAEHDRLADELEACENGECAHERKLKKDGTPDKRYPCPEGYSLYNEVCNTGNGLEYYYHLSLFRKIGLIER